MPGIVAALTESGTPFSILTKGTLLRRDLPLLRMPRHPSAYDRHVDRRLRRRAAAQSSSRAPHRCGAPRDGPGGDRGRIPGHGVPDADPPPPDRLDRGDRRRARPDQAARSPRVVYGALHLRPGAKQWFMQWLGREHPELVLVVPGPLPGCVCHRPQGYRSWLAKRVRPILRAIGLHGRARGGGLPPRAGLGRRADAGALPTSGVLMRRRPGTGIRDALSDSVVEGRRCRGRTSRHARRRWPVEVGDLVVSPSRTIQHAFRKVVLRVARLGSGTSIRPRSVVVAAIGIAREVVRPPAMSSYPDDGPDDTSAVGRDQQEVGTDGGGSRHVAVRVVPGTRQPDRVPSERTTRRRDHRGGE